MVDRVPWESAEGKCISTLVVGTSRVLDFNIDLCELTAMCTPKDCLPHSTNGLFSAARASLKLEFPEKHADVVQTLRFGNLSSPLLQSCARHLLRRGSRPDSLQMRAAALRDYQQYLFRAALAQKVWSLPCLTD